MSNFVLANALSQLEELVQDKKYAEISQTLAVGIEQCMNRPYSE